ncbi:MAG: hypothetical protein GF308_01505 [Candidatus Heimdallarchaeota archaeon]|nr:hypothetical protein [Candidatus Heimdallarchaeota archaeon]
MKKKQKILMDFLVISLFLVSFIPLKDTNGLTEQWSVPFSIISPTIDGLIKENSEWVDATHYPIEFQYDSEYNPILNAILYLKYTDEAFFIGLDFECPTDNDIEEKDGIGIELDLTCDGLTSGTEEGVFANYGGLINHSYFLNSEWVEDSLDQNDTLVKSKTYERSWEFCLFWDPNDIEDLNIAPPQIGDEHFQMGINIWRVDWDYGEYISSDSCTTDEKDQNNRLDSTNWNQLLFNTKASWMVFKQADFDPIINGEIAPDEWYSIPEIIQFEFVNFPFQNPVIEAKVYSQHNSSHFFLALDFSYGKNDDYFEKEDALAIYLDLNFNQELDENNEELLIISAGGDLKHKYYQAGEWVEDTIDETNTGAACNINNQHWEIYWEEDVNDTQDFNHELPALDNNETKIGINIVYWDYDQDQLTGQDSCVTTEEEACQEFYPWTWSQIIFSIEELSEPITTTPSPTTTTPLTTTLPPTSPQPSSSQPPTSSTPSQETTTGLTTKTGLGYIAFFSISIPTTITIIIIVRKKRR